MEKLDQPRPCFTEHPGFGPVCLNEYVLEMSYNHFKVAYGNIDASREEYVKLIKYPIRYTHKHPPTHARTHAHTILLLPLQHT